MLYYKGQWCLCTEKVRYIQHGEEIIQYVGAEGHDWWLDFEQQWEHTEIIEFIPVEPTGEQLVRLEEVNEIGVGDGYSTIVEEYVINEKFPEGLTHPLRNLQLGKEQELQDSYLLDLDFRQSITELGV